MIVNLISLIGAALWWISAPDWEPAVTTTGLFGALLAQVFTNEEFKQKVGLSISSKKNSKNYQSARDISVIDNAMNLKAGNNSENYQGKFIIINRGFTYEETKSIARDVFDEREKELTERLLKKFSEENSHQQ